MKIKNSICFVAGRSGGHLIPGLTIAQEVCKKNKHTHILFFTTNSPIDQKIVKNNKRITHWIKIDVDNVPDTKIKYPFFLCTLIIACFKSVITLIKDRPKKVISMGGYISIPVCIAAYILRIPIELYELNATPGKAVKLLAKIATKINICFKNATHYLPKKKCQITHYPIRFTENRDSEKSISHFCKTKKTVLILGGSQGSIAINTIIKQWIEKSNSVHNNIQIIHQTGNYDTTNWQAFYKKKKFPVIYFDFKNDIQQYYKAADIIICRSGAGSLFETLFFKKKCITIPLETKKTAHQLDNAKEIKKVYPKLVTIVRQQEINKDIGLFFREINKHLEI